MTKIGIEKEIVDEKDEDELSYNFVVNGGKYRFARRSLFLFGEQNKIRKLCVKIHQSKWFDNFILATILVNSLVLALTDYSNVDREGRPSVEGSWRNAVVEATESVFTSIFTVEFLIKAIGMGMILDKGSYLRDGWNWLDFIVVVSGLLSTIPGIPRISALRTFRVLRPLRSVKGIRGMRVLVNSLLTSIPGLANVGLLVVFILLIFGILGVELFAGLTYFKCRVSPYPLYQNETKCNSDGVTCYDLDPPIDLNSFTPCIPDAVVLHDRLSSEEIDRFFDYNKRTSPWAEPKDSCEWPVSPDHPRVCSVAGTGRYSCPKYDEEGNELNLFCGSSYDFWNNPKFTDEKIMNVNYLFEQHWGYGKFDHIGYAFVSMMYAITSERYIDVMFMLQDAQNPIVAAVYFVLFVVLGSFFLLNLSLAVIYDNFSKAQEQEDILKQAAKEEKEKMKSQNLQKTPSRPSKKSNNALVKWSYDIIMTPSFNLFILLIIILNTVILAMDKYPMDDKLENILDWINVVLTFIFGIEMVIKLIGLGIMDYANDRFNLFDAAIVVFSIIELALVPPGSNRDAGGISALRGFRLLRVFKLAKNWKSLRDLINTLFKTVSDVANFAVLLFLFLYIYSLIGMQLYANRFCFADDGDGYPVPQEELLDKYFQMKESAEKTPTMIEVCESLGGDVPHENFDDLVWSFISVFQLFTGEDWHEIMHPAWRATGWTSTLYFFSNILIGNMIFLDLFVAIFLGNFEQKEEEGGNEGQPQDELLVQFARSASQRLLSFVQAESKSKINPQGEDNDSSGTLVGNQIQPSPSNTNNRRSISIAGKPDEENCDLSVHNPRDGQDHWSPEMVEPIKDLKDSKVINDDKPPLNGVALWIFPVDHPFRAGIAKITQAQSFESIILLLIIISSLLLAIDNPLWPPDSRIVKVLTIMDYVMTILFTLEMMAKTLTYGFLLHKHSYLRNSWNVLDFIIVVISLISVFVSGNSSFKAVRSLRTLRALRPLRMISRNPGLKLVVNALFRSIPAVLNSMFVCLLFFFIFGIIGVNYFKGSLFACQGDVFDELPEDVQDLITNPVGFNISTPLFKTVEELSSSNNVSVEYWDQFVLANNDKTMTSKIVCEAVGADWEHVIPSHFDNIFQSVTTLFEMSSTEGWQDVTHACVDSVGIDMQPKRNNAPGWAFLFIIFMIVGCFFLMNMFVGVVIDNFKRMKEELGGSVFLTETQKDWVKTQRTMLKMKPIKRKEVPKSPFRAKCYHFSTHPYFEPCIMLCIGLNTIILSMRSLNQPVEMAVFIEFANNTFAVIFTLEFIVKFIALSWDYFRDNWNIFDFSIVVGTNVGILLRMITGSGFGAVATVIRTFRIGRVFRLVKSFKSLRTLFNTLILTLPGLANISGLLSLLFFIYAVMGVNMFAKVKFDDEYSVHSNFQDFWNAVLMLFRCSTGEEWNSVMHELTVDEDCRVDPPYDHRVCGFSVAPHVCLDLDGDDGSSQFSLYDEDPVACDDNGGRMAACTPIDGCGNAASYPYFISFTLLMYFIMVNVFVAVILEGFEDCTSAEEAKLKEDEFKTFCVRWADYDPHATCFITTENLFHFLQHLERPLGFGDYEASRKELKDMISQLQLPTYEGNLVHFSDVCRALARRLIELEAREKGERLQDLPEKEVSNLENQWAKKYPSRNVISKTPFTIGHYYASLSIQSAFRAFKMREQMSIETKQTTSIDDTNDDKADKRMEL